MKEKEKIVFKLLRENKISDEEASILLSEETRMDYIPYNPYVQPWITTPSFEFTSN